MHNMSRGYNISARTGRHLKINHLSAACSLSFRRTMDSPLGVNSAYLVELQKCSKLGARWDFSGNPVVKTWCFHRRGVGSIPGQGTKIPHIIQRGKKIKKQFDKMT